MKTRKGNKFKNILSALFLIFPRITSCNKGFLPELKRGWDVDSVSRAGGAALPGAAGRRPRPAAGLARHKLSVFRLTARQTDFIYLCGVRGRNASCT